jgi:hypothetical protein
MCTDPLATNYTDPIKLSQGELVDNCSCEYPTNKITCSRFFSTNYTSPNYDNKERRCGDDKAYNFEINSKFIDNSLCQYESNNSCVFPSSTSNVNSLFDIISNPDEFFSLQNADGTINYNNILRAGPCIPANKNRGPKLDLYFRLFNRTVNKLSLSSLDPIFNIWDFSGKITQDQLKADYNKVVRTYKFVEEGLTTSIDVLGYGIDLPTTASYSDIVNKIYNNPINDRIKYVALAVSNDGNKYAIGIGKTKDIAIDIAITNAILFEPLSDNNINNNQSLQLDRSYTRTIYLFQKAKNLTNAEYNRLKNDINNNKIVSDDNKTLVLYRDKLNDNISNPIGILMVNNTRYFKYNNNPEIIDKCSSVLTSITSQCNNTNKDINGNRNCNEVVMLHYDKTKDKCNTLQSSKNVIKNADYNLSNNTNIKEITINSPIKLINSLLIESSCNDDNSNCLIYSVNDKRFCKELYN